MPTDPVPRAEGSPETGETGAAYGNPAMLAAGEKMRARKLSWSQTATSFSSAPGANTMLRATT